MLLDKSPERSLPRLLEDSVSYTDRASIWGRVSTRSEYTHQGFKVLDAIG